MIQCIKVEEVCADCPDTGTLALLKPAVINPIVTEYYFLTLTDDGTYLHGPFEDEETGARIAKKDSNYQSAFDYISTIEIKRSSGAKIEIDGWTSDTDDIDDEDELCP